MPMAMWFVMVPMFLFVPLKMTVLLFHFMMKAWFLLHHIHFSAGVLMVLVPAGESTSTGKTQGHGH